MAEEDLHRRTDRRRLLRIYLNDQLVAATGGVELARRCEKSNAGTPLGQHLEVLVGEMEQDRAALVSLLQTLDLRVDRLKAALGGIGEKVGRLKLNGSLLHYSDLSRVFELEGLAAIVSIKLGLWRSLAAAAETDPQLAAVDFDRLTERGKEQLAGLQPHRLEAARRAFV